MGTYPSYVNDGACDNDSYGGYDYCVGECGDYIDCRVKVPNAFTCDDCAAAGGVWCGAAALCMQEVPLISWLKQGDAELCGSTDAWLSTCLASNTGFSDPAYEAQSWVYDLINVVPAWAEGWTGAGVQIVFNDDGLDIAHPDLAGKFTEEGSCVGRNVSTPKDISHGTATAAIALGAANTDCSVGIAPGATLAGCPMLGRIMVNETEELVPGLPADPLSYRLDVNHISSNSWGQDPCSKKEEDRRRLQAAPSCSFTGASNPCDEAPECALVGTAFANEEGCIRAIRAYCEDNPKWTVEDLDPGCHDWWHLSMACAYTDLSPSEVAALESAVTTGRGGKGTIFVFSSGNENLAGEDLNFEAHLFTRFTIAVGAVGKQGHHSSYSVAGAALLVSAPGGDDEYSVNHVVAMPGGTCGNVDVGTSYAAPVVSGVVALMLEAAPELTWRDVQGILATTSQKTDPEDESWATNGAGLSHSGKYGFGIVDAHAAVTAARSWYGYGPELEVTSTSADVDLMLPGDGSVTTTEAVVTDSGTAVTVEHVYVYLDLDHSSRGDLHIELVSPAGTRSVLVPGPRPAPSAGQTIVTICGPTTDGCRFAGDAVCDAPQYCQCDYNDCLGQDPPPFPAWPSLPDSYGPTTWNWKMATVRAWGERAVGTWRLEIRNKRNPMAPEQSPSPEDTYIYGYTGEASPSPEAAPEAKAPQMLKSWSVYVFGHDSALDTLLAPLPPPSPPAPPPPPPPLPPGAWSQPAIELALTVAGTVDSFDEVSFKTGLATAVGVASEDISLTVTAASVNVVATIAAADASDAANVLSSVQALASDATALTEAVGVAVERVEAPVLTTVIVLASSPPTPAPSCATSDDCPSGQRCVFARRRLVKGAATTWKSRLQKRGFRALLFGRAPATGTCK